MIIRGFVQIFLAASILLPATAVQAQWFKLPGHKPVSAEDGRVVLDLDKVGDGNAHFFVYTHGEKAVRFFVVEDENGTVQAALDACELCYDKKMGYERQGVLMVCNSCGTTTPTATIDNEPGRCKPIALEREVTGGKVIIEASELAEGAKYF
jgi:uncharacterized membrane protein